jgi:histidine phosphotransfer protein HptB
MSYSDIIDDSALSALSDMVAGDPAFLAEMIDAFTEEAPAMLALMQSSLATGDAAELRRAAHSLKSNSATFGAMAWRTSE